MDSTTLIDESLSLQRFLCSGKGHKNCLLSKVPGILCVIVRYDNGDQKELMEEETFEMHFKAHVDEKSIVPAN